MNIDSKRVGATGLVGLFINDKAYIANVGDTRAVLSRGGKAERVSVDHKPLSKEEMQRITDLGGFVMETGRVNGILGVARSLGDFYLRPYVSSDPYTTSFDITSETQFLIFACDGVWDMVSDELAVTIVKNSLASNSDPTLAAVTLRDFAYLLGSTDNISVVIIVLHK